MIKLLIIFLFCSPSILSREVGQTEITTDEGIEVFQKEKFYLLKKNVSIISDNFELKADLVKAYFDKDLYDISKIESETDVILKSSKGILAKGNKINFSTKNENITIKGNNSSLTYGNIYMFSQDLVKVDNLNGNFLIKGNGAELKTDSIHIFGSLIKGNFVTIDKVNEVEKLYVEDDKQANIKTEKINMFAKKANYNKQDNIIELFENVKVIRGNEIITGDYANIDTLNESYKVKSNNDNEKVKVLISQTNE
jgi:lipopolysaccharide export system protein LptA